MPDDEESDEDWRQMKAYLVQTGARRELRQYLDSRIGLHVWRAYADFRLAGMPVPENILAKLDEWAAALERAENDAQVAAAIEMGTIGRKPAKTRMAAAERSYLVMEQLNIRERVLERKQQPMEAARAVAADQGLSLAIVKNMKTAWNKRHQITKPKKTRIRSSAASASAASAMDQHWHSKLREPK
jgi:hypothetical protein